MKTLRRRTWLLSLGLAGVFLAGALTGVFAAAGYVHHRLRALHAQGPHAVHVLGMQWLDWELDLEPDQERRIEDILHDAHMDLFRFKSRHNDELRAIVHAAVERIDRELTPEQARHWQALRARIAEHADATVESRSGD